jgi:hypothetical protein
MKEVDSNSVERDSDAALDWLAYQYVVGELSERDALAFVERLAVDQRAREALAATVELAYAVTLAGDAYVSTAKTAVHRVNLPRRQSFWLKPVGSLAASAAAALFLAAILQLLWPASHQAESAIDASLLAEWTEIRNVTGDDWSDATARHDTSENGWNGLAALTAPEDIAESSWLLTALAPDAVMPGEKEVHQQ